MGATPIQAKPTGSWDLLLEAGVLGGFCEEDQKMPVMDPSVQDALSTDFADKQDLLGKGTFAHVYRKGSLAVKVLKPWQDDPRNKDLSKISRVSGEMLALGLRHPNVLEVLGVRAQNDDGDTFVFFDQRDLQIFNGCLIKSIAYPLAEQGSLADLLVQGPLPLQQCAGLVHGVAQALFFLVKQNNIIHRDVKPANILITRDGCAKLADFGLAITFPNQDRHVVGSPNYVAPEHITQKEDQRFMDFWSLGATAFEMGSRAKPFGGKDLRGLLLAIKEFGKQQEQDIEETRGIKPNHRLLVKAEPRLQAMRAHHTISWESAGDLNLCQVYMRVIDGLLAITKVRATEGFAALSDLESFVATG